MHNRGVRHVIQPHEAEQRIRALMALRGHTSLRSLSRASGVEIHGLISTLRGQTTPKPRTVEKLADALGMSVDELVMILPVRGAK
jgi:lambda repressor-like predicted transcriptional regulator